MSGNYSYATVMATVHAKVQDQYEELRKEAAEDPQKAGHGGEGTWAALLRDWLPTGYEVATRKYIVLEDGTETPEIDIVVQRPGCPPAMRALDGHKVLAGVVAAAFSVKTTLTGSDLPIEIKRGIQLKRGLRAREGTPQTEILPAFPYGILAHSHEWKADRPRKTPVDHISMRLLETQNAQVHHPRELIDFVCVADAAFWGTQRVTYIGPPVAARGFPFSTEKQRANGIVLTATVCTEQMFVPSVYSTPGVGTWGAQIGPTLEGYKPPPVAAFITALLTRLSYQDSSVAPVAQALRINGNVGMMNGPTRYWDPAEIYSGNQFLRLPDSPVAILF